MNKLNSKAALFGATCIAALALTGVEPAVAQEAPADQSAQAQDAAPGNEDSAKKKDDESAIVVTGSRLRTNEFTSASPISIIDPQLATRQGKIDTAETLQSSPIASGSSQITAAISSNFVTNGGSGAQTISLRGLGAERTLVLLNGRRAGPAGTRGAVSSFDLNALPQSLVERVDVLKDGASSIYGSDAVAGVVNIITRRDTHGIELDGFASVPQDTGGGQYSLSATWGKSFDRGHVLFSGNYYHRDELARGQRSYLRCEEDYVFSDTTFKTRIDLIDPRTGKPHCNGPQPWGHVWTYDYSYYYSPNGTNIPGSQGVGDVTLFQYNYPGDNLGSHVPPIGAQLDPGQVHVPAGWYPVGYDPASIAVQNNYHPFNDHDTLIPKTDRYTGYLEGSYELSDHIEAYTELLFSRRETYVNASRQIWHFGLGEDFAGSPGDPLAPGWGGAALFSPTGITDQFDSSQRVDYYRGVGGFRGDIGTNWRYDVVAQYSKSKGTYNNQQTLADSIAIGDFRTGPCVGQTTPVAGKACVDLPWFDPNFLAGQMTQAQKDFLFQWETGHTDYTQWYAEATLANDKLFTLPGGDVGLSIGATYREDRINDTPGPITLAGNAWGVTASGITAGKAETAEAFAELNLPILADQPFFKALTLNGAARITNVKSIRASDGFSDSDKGNWTYKLGLNWAINDWLRLRGTYGTSYRAPALFEQFLANQTSFLGQRSIDPCIQWGTNLANGSISQQFANNCAASGVPANYTGAGVSATVITGGGIGRLDPETSRAWTASVVLTPKFDFLPDTRVSLAVDYFDIEVKGEIAQLGARNILAGCYNSQFFPTDPLCSLFRRIGQVPGQAGNPSNVFDVTDSYINVNRQKNRGVDATLVVTHDFGNDTKLKLQAQMTWQIEDGTGLFATTFTSDNGQGGEPRWTGEFNATLDHGPWSLVYGLDMVGSTDNTAFYLERNPSICGNTVAYPTGRCLKLKTGAWFQHSLSLTREIGDRFEITFGVSNITDARPPRVSQAGGTGLSTLGAGVFYSQYDLVGRRGFIGIKAKY